MTRISTRIDFEKDGHQSDYLRLQHSVHGSGYFMLMMPIVSIKNGNGPTILLMSGNHGDEYEGQIVLSKMIRSLQKSDIQGRIIILPMANYPAAKAGLRTSPIDDGNLNRSFPGDPAGTVTQQIAYYIEHHLMLMADYVLDIHSGGTAGKFAPSSIIVGGLDDRASLNARAQMAMAFNAPYTFLYDLSPEVRHLGTGMSGGAERQSALGLAIEMTGGGRIDPQDLKLCEVGLYSVLKHLKILHNDGSSVSRRSTRFMKGTGNEDLTFAMDTGLLESVVNLGDEIKAGDVAGYLHFPETPGKEPIEYRFATSGLVYFIRAIVQTNRGDLLFRVARDAELDENTNQFVR